MEAATILRFLNIKQKSLQTPAKKESEGFEYDTSSFSFQAKEPARFLTVACNEHEKKRLLTSGFNPTPSPSCSPEAYSGC